MTLQITFSLPGNTGATVRHDVACTLATLESALAEALAWGKARNLPVTAWTVGA